MSWLRTIGSAMFRHGGRTLIPRGARTLHHSVVLNSTDDEMECRFLDFFNRADIDGWDVRQGMNDLLGLDLIPDPTVIMAALAACRRINDYAVAVRFLEALKNKCGQRAPEIYPWLIQEITPCICELGIDTPEELGYDKPEMYLPEPSF